MFFSIDKAKISQLFLLDKLLSGQGYNPEIFFLISALYGKVGLRVQIKHKYALFELKKTRILRFWSLDLPIEMTEFNNPIFNVETGLSKIGLLGFFNFFAPFLTFLPRLGVVLLRFGRVKRTMNKPQNCFWLLFDF